VKNCATDATNAAICQTAIDLAHRFGSAAVADGVEAAIDLQALVVMGCDFGQGVLIAPPMPQERFLGLLQQRLNKPAAQPAAEAPAAAPAAMGRMPMTAGSRI
jgi:EAL domain-containing protein (putative c-di-GMP-specific phosphodiesterase class I)